MVGPGLHQKRKRGRQPTPHQFVGGVESKWCGGCEAVVPLGSFEKALQCKSTPDGLRSRCRECRRRESRAYHARAAAKTWPAVETKRCATCKTQKPLSAFRRQASAAYGRQSRCRECSDIYNNRWRERRRPERLAYNRDYYRSPRGRAVLAKWRDNNPIKIRTHSLVDDAVARGVIVKPATCERCGSDARLDSHHPDYAKPLEVEWLCRKCHKGWHRQHGEGLNAEGGAQSATG